MIHVKEKKSKKRIQFWGVEFSASTSMVKLGKPLAALKLVKCINKQKRTVLLACKSTKIKRKFSYRYKGKEFSLTLQQFYVYYVFSIQRTTTGTAVNLTVGYLGLNITIVVSLLMFQAKGTDSLIARQIKYVPKQYQTNLSTPGRAAVYATAPLRQWKIINYLEQQLESGLHNLSRPICFTATFLSIHLLTPQKQRKAIISR